MISPLFCPVCGAANERERADCFACGQPLPTEKEQMEAQDEVLLRERYQLGTLLGSGGFSAVYRARDLSERGRIVAIKQINLQELSAEEIIEVTDTFNREVQVLSTLSHPQVPRIYDHFSDQKHWYLVLEYIEGQTLETYLSTRETQGKSLSIEEVLAIASQLCVVLEYLHGCHPPIIYRDLKPSNIMRTPAGKLALIDFGIARHFRPGQKRDTQPLGSPGYAAPEQYGRAQTTPQTDIYSLGVLLSQLLSGQDPSNNPPGLLPLHRNGQAGNEDLEALISRMLLPQPEERPESVRIVAEEIERIKHMLASENVHIWQPPTPQAYPESDSPQIQLQLLPQAPAQLTWAPLARPGWTNPPPVDRNTGFALAGFYLGIANLIFSFVPCYGVLPVIVGITLSCYGLSSISRKKLAIAGLVLSIIAAAIALGSCALNFNYQGM